MSTEGKILDPVKTINGAYGELFVIGDDGEGGETREFLANTQSFEARISVDRTEVRRSGTRRMGYKRGMISGEGTLRGFKVTSRWASAFSDELNEDGNLQSTYVFESRLEDPESLGSEVVRLTGVRVWELPIGWAVGDLIEEDIPFTFEDYDVVDPITGEFTVDSPVTGFGA